MIPIHISSQVKINTRLLARDQKRAIEKFCTVPNKEYYDQLEFNTWINPAIPQSYSVYEYVGDYIHIPRGALDGVIDILDYNVELIYETAIFEKIGLKFVEEMSEREYQTEAIEALLEHDSGILVAPTASGKTNIMIRLIVELDQPTLILVHRDHLLNQWQERIHHFLGYEVGIIGRGKWKVKNVTIAMIPTLHLNQSKVRKLRKRFGVVIIDECHHIPAYTWISNIIHLGANNIYGCSATPKRKDDLQKLMYLGVGPIRHIVHDATIVRAGSIMPVKVIAIRTNFQGWVINTKIGFNKMMPSLVTDSERNSLIIREISKNSEHRQLVLSDRLQHLNILEHLLEKQPKIKVKKVIGETPPKQRQLIFQELTDGEINVILASSVADEGLDIPSLDRLHLCFPTANPERTMQQVGRIRRISENKKDALVFDYFDWKNSTLNKQFQARKRKYRANGFEVQILGGLR